MREAAVHEMVLTGGTTRIPKLESLLCDLFNGKVRRCRLTLSKPR